MLAKRFIRKVRNIVGQNNCHDNMVTLEMYAYDASPFIHPPALVVFPGSTREVAKVMQAAWTSGVAVVPRGAGTCLSGGAVALGEEIILVLTRINNILEIDDISETALVEAGVLNMDLQQAVEPLGYMFAPDPASMNVSTIGGNIAECAGGIRGVKYGVTKNHILGLEVVLANGRVTTVGTLSHDDAFAPDLSGIFIGAEGTFGIVTKAQVRLTRLPQAVQTAMAVFDSLHKTGEVVSAIIGKGVVPSALEIMDRTMLRAVDEFLHIGFPPKAEAILLMEVDGYRTEIDQQFETAIGLCRQMGAQQVKIAKDAKERGRLWLARRSGNGALGRIKPNYMVQDVTVPRHRLPEMLAAVQQIAENQKITIAQMAHAGDGNLHPHLLYDSENNDEIKRVHKACRKIYEAALHMEGTLTGEHGIGLEKKKFMDMQFTRTDLQVMASVKQALDPDMVLNPGKVLPESTAIKNEKVVI